MRISIRYKRYIGNHTRFAVLWRLNVDNDGLWSSVRISRQKGCVDFCAKNRKAQRTTATSRIRVAEMDRIIKGFVAGTAVAELSQEDDVLVGTLELPREVRLRQ